MVDQQVAFVVHRVTQEALRDLTKVLRPVVFIHSMRRQVRFATERHRTLQTLVEVVNVLLGNVPSQGFFRVEFGRAHGAGVYGLT